VNKAFLVASSAVAVMLLSSPASAQYSFDRRIDPTMCRWWQTCDYGGRAYRGYRFIHARHCPVESVERRLPDGSIVVDRRRHCGVVRVRG
jgi:hypothetical protein